MRPLHLRLPVEPTTPREVRRQLRLWLQNRGWPREQADDLLLAVNEAVSNVVEHAYPGPAVRADHAHRDVELCVTDALGSDDDTHHAVMTVTDHGRWKPRAIPHGSRGRGLQMMHALTESLEVTATGSGTRVKMISRAVQLGRRGVATVTTHLGNASRRPLGGFHPGIA